VNDLTKVFVYCAQKPAMTTTKKGYIRSNKDEHGKLRFEHCLVWERHYGKIPAGMQIHHKDFDKTNNDINNLQLVTPLEHKRLHSGCRIVNNEWEKPCAGCGEFKRCDKENWYFSNGWINGRLCKSCFITKSLKVRTELIAKGWKRKAYPKTISKQEIKDLTNIRVN
jgi:hypothetical protein